MHLQITFDLWLAAFLFTQAVELPVYLLATRGRPLPQRLALGLGASALTHPVVWWVIPRLPWETYRAYFLAAEGFAVAVEALLLAAFRVRRPLLWALVANAASVALGRLTRATLGWP